MRWRLLMLFLGLAAVGVAGAEVELHYFWSATCPDCLVMKAYLAELQKTYPELKVVAHEVTFNPDNWRLMVTLGKAYGLTKEVTPTVFVGNLAVTGVGLAVELQIEEEVVRCRTAGCPSPLERLPGKLRRVLSPLEIVLILVVGAVVFLLLGK
ncbi:MAG: thioredoxin family protein [Candidatus Bipolaricaulota bacterium]|nr:thioredoxin family protein [Candidatus Bipolaricaulota bacterium]